MKSTKPRGRPRKTIKEEKIEEEEEIIKEEIKEEKEEKEEYEESGIEDESLIINCSHDKIDDEMVSKMEEKIKNTVIFYNDPKIYIHTDNSEIDVLKYIVKLQNLFELKKEKTMFVIHTTEYVENVGFVNSFISKEYFKDFKGYFGSKKGRYVFIKDHPNISVEDLYERIHSNVNKNYGNYVVETIG